MFRASWSLRIFLAGLLAIGPRAQAALYTDASDLPKSTYDFVIVGAGTAGSVIAGRLTENSAFSVLVIEAGPSDSGILGVEVPFLAPTNVPFSAVTWNFTTVPQTELNNRVLTYARGRVLGGSSSINFLAYTRGSDEEYDLWAKLTGDQGWSWDNVQQYYLKNSRLVPPADNHSTVGEVNPADHGNGPVEISLPGLTEINNRVLNTSKTDPEFPFNLDINGGNAIGFGLTQSTIGGGQRSSSSSAYLQPNLNRPNLDVLVQNTVTKLVQTGTEGGVPSFKQVEFAPSATAKPFTVTANNEVILSAGSVGSAQILLLSGIGNGTELRAVGVTPLVNLPDVGRNLQDHPIMTNYWNVSSNQTYDDVLRNPAILGADLNQWETTHTGLFSASSVPGIGFIRLPSNASIFESTPDPAAGPNSAHMELLFSDGYGATVDPQPPTGNFLTVFTAVVSPTSRGQITLASSDPFAFPTIDPNFFSTAFDQYAMVQVVKAARRFVQTPPWEGFILGQFGVIGEAETDDEILAASRQEIVTIWHPTSTASMSPRNASWGVVDPDLLVKGTNGIRVVDASVIPHIPSVHPVAAVYILAERAADLIKQAWA